jgi:CHASE2 domain-containing sensor protein
MARETVYSLDSALRSTLDSMCGNRRIVRFILALALAIVGALGAIYVLFFAAGGYFITAAASAISLGVGLIWLSDFIDTPSP